MLAQHCRGDLELVYAKYGFSVFAVFADLVVFDNDDQVVVERDMVAGGEAILVGGSRGARHFALMARGEQRWLGY